MKSLFQTICLPLIVTAILSGCSQKSEPSNLNSSAKDEASATTAIAPDPSPATTTVSSKTPPRNGDRPVSVKHYSTEIPYYNRGSGPINVYTGPSTNASIKDSLAVNDGGFIQQCSSIVPDWCEITYGRYDKTGWVYMPLLSGQADAVEMAPDGTDTNRLAESQETIAQCVIEGTSGEVRFQGDCIFNQFAGNGSFTIESPSGLIDGRSLITVAVIDPGVAEVRGLTTDGINSRWGEAGRSESDSACWVGSDFTICAR